MLSEPYPRTLFPFTSRFPAVVTWLGIPHPRTNNILHIRASLVLDLLHNERQFNESDVPESTAPPVSPHLPSTSSPKCPFTTTSLVYWPTPAHLATRNWVGLGWIAATSSHPPPLLWTLSTHISLRNNTHRLLVDSCMPGSSEFRWTGLWVRKSLDRVDKLGPRTRTVSGMGGRGR